MQNGELVFIFWNVRGTGQTLRDLLQYLQLKHIDKKIEWPMDIQYTLHNVTEYQKMPKLKNGDFEVTELVPIAKYICRFANRHDLLGKTIKEEALIDRFITKTLVARAILIQITNNMLKLDDSSYQKFLLKKQKQLNQMFINSLIQRLKDQDWAFEYLSVADFFLYNALFYIQGCIPSIGQHEVINAYMKRYENIDILNNYFKSGQANLPVTLSDKLLKKWKGRKTYTFD